MSRGGGRDVERENRELEAEIGGRVLEDDKGSDSRGRRRD